MNSIRSHEDTRMKNNHSLSVSSSRSKTNDFSRPKQQLSKAKNRVPISPFFRIFRTKQIYYHHKSWTKRETFLSIKSDNFGRSEDSGKNIDRGK